MMMFFTKVPPVMAFLIKNLGVIQGHIGHEAHASCHLILTAGKHGILIVIAVTHNGLKGPPSKLTMASRELPTFRAASGHLSPGGSCRCRR